MGTAEQLLRECCPSSEGGQSQLQLLQSLCLLASQDKASMEAALGTIVEMAQAEVLAGGDGRGMHVDGASLGLWGKAGPGPKPTLASHCTEGLCRRPAGHGTGLHAAEAGPQGTHTVEASGQSPMGACRG